LILEEIVNAGHGAIDTGHVQFEINTYRNVIRVLNDQLGQLKLENDDLKNRNKKRLGLNGDDVEVEILEQLG